MKTITILEKAKRGDSISINLKDKTVKVNGIPVKYEGESPIDFETEMLQLYETYRYSRPTRKRESRYFKAVPIDELTTMQLAMNEDRNIARIKLELFMLANYQNGNIATLFEENHWFFYKNGSLVILKNWF